MALFTLQTEDQFQTVLGDLPAYYPKSYPIEALLRNSLTKNSCAWPGVEYVVDQFPDWNVCICRPSNSDSKEYVNRQTQYAVSLFCKTVAALEPFLNHPDVVDWAKPVNFCALPKPEVYDVVRRKCESINPKLKWGGTENFYVFLLHPDKIQSAILPAGLRLGELHGHKHAEYVQERWDWADEETKPYFEFLVTPTETNHFPNSAIFDIDTGLPVAYILYTADGSLGCGYVAPKYRNQKLFQIVNYDAAQKVFKMGQKVAWAYVLDENEASIRAYRRMGAEECDYRVQWVISSPLEKVEITDSFPHAVDMENSKAGSTVF